MRYRYILAASLAASAACTNPVGPDGPDPRRDSGTLVITVVDSGGAPLDGVWVYVEMPNNVGGVFKEGTATRNGGSATFYYVPSGRRTIEVKPPAGYAVDGDVTQPVDVVRDRTTTARYILRRT